VIFAGCGGEDLIDVTAGAWSYFRANQNFCQQIGLA